MTRLVVLVVSGLAMTACSNGSTGSDSCRDEADCATTVQTASTTDGRRESTAAASTLAVDATSTVPASAHAWNAADAAVLGVEPEVLYVAATGSGAGEFGLEDCRECDPGRPWQPLVDSAGRIIVADTMNRRWVTIEQGSFLTVPYPSTSDVTGLALGPNDIVYVLYAEADGSDLLAAYSSSNLAEPLRSTAVTAPRFSRLTFVADTVLVNGGQRVPLVEGHSRRPVVTPAFNSSPPTLAVSFEDGSAASWLLTDRQSPMLPEGLENQSVFVAGVDDSHAPTQTFVGYELTPDGLASGVAMPGGSDALNGGLFVDGVGIVRLRHDLSRDVWLIERFPLPSTIG